MPLPKQVQEQVTAAEQLAANLNEQPPAETPPANEPTNLETPPAAPPTPPAETPPTDDQKWEQRYKSLQGRYNREIPHYQTQIQNLNARNVQLEERIAAMEEHIAASMSTAAPTPKKGVTQEDIDQYGGDLVDLIRRQAEAIAEERVAAVERENEQLRAQLTQVDQNTAQMSRNQFFIALDGQVPEWRQLNEDQDFADWLDEPDAITGYSKRSFLGEAVHALDVSRAAKIFKAYLDSLKRVAPPPPPPPRETLESQVSPSRRTGSNPTAGAPQQEAKVWKRSEIKTFHDDVSRGRYINQPSVKLRLDNEIFSAIKEGRVVDG